jgi:hypothetical protein
MANFFGGFKATLKLGAYVALHLISFFFVVFVDISV